MEFIHRTVHSYKKIFHISALSPTPMRGQDDASSDSAVSMGSQSVGSPEQVLVLQLSVLDTEL